MMKTLHIKPSASYLRKLWVTCTIIALATVLVGYLFGLLVGIDEGVHVTIAITVYMAIFAGLFWLTAVILSVFYYRSLSYEIQDDEIIVRVGIVTKSVKHVPYRTVTNISIKRGILDRFMFDIGTLAVQTAGMSGTSGAEQSLVGLVDVQAIYDDVVIKLREFRGAMSPTAAEEDTVQESPRGDVMASMLEELRAIRRSVEK
jgi:membrane protein YdbS with pleckstrin-like domain